GGALDLRARLGRPAALAARRLGSRRRSRLPRRRPAGARGGRRVRRAGDGGRQAEPQRDGVWLHRPRQAAWRRARSAALRREAIGGARRAAAAARGALEHWPVCVGRGALSRRGGRLRPRAQAGLAGPRGGRHRRFLRCGAPGRGRRRGAGADQAAEATRAAAVTHALYLLDPEPGVAWAPFLGARPLCELRAGAHLIRERWEAFVGAEAAGIFALPHLAGFTEPGTPAVTPR